MRSNILFLGLLVLAACGSSLSDEQRKQLKEASEQQTIKRVIEADLVSEVFIIGRSILEQLEVDQSQRNLLQDQYSAKIKWLEPGAANASEIESQLIEAYLNSFLLGEELKDNVQQVGTDSLLYTKPVIVELPDGRVEVKGTWNITLSRKNIVLGMDSD